VLVTDVLLLDDEQVQAAGGVLAQAMPGSDPSRLASIREGLQGGRFADRLGGVPTAADLFAGLFPGAERLEPPVHVHWQCRCSIERVIASIRMLEPADLADLVNRNSSVAVTCDFCRRVFDVEPAQIREAYEGTIRGNG
jgi:molecular chaperone Hsp33